MPYQKERLGELLIRAGLLTDEQLADALDRQQREGGKLGEILVSELVLTEDQIASVLARQKGYRHVNLANARIDRDAALLLPLRMARKRGVIPIATDGSTLTLAMADPLDVEAIDEAEIRTGLKVEPVVAPRSQVLFAIEKFIAGGDALLELELTDRPSEAEQEAAAEARTDGEVPVVRVINQVFREAVAERASDVHFEPDTDSVRISFWTSVVNSDTQKGSITRRT